MLFTINISIVYAESMIENIRRYCVYACSDCEWCVSISWTLSLFVCLSQIGYTALIVSASSGHLEVVRLLLDRGADPNATDKVGNHWPPHTDTVSCHSYIGTYLHSYVRSCDYQHFNHGTSLPTNPLPDWHTDMDALTPYYFYVRCA